jgi:hypothetical protein
MHNYSLSKKINLNVSYLREYLNFIHNIDTIGSNLEIEYRNETMIVYIYGKKSDEIEITYSQYNEWERLMFIKEKLNKLLKNG